VRFGFLNDCVMHYGNKFGPFEKEEELPRMRFHPMYYRFHRYIPRRRLWMGW
jgi:hypothetical protein